MCMFHRLFSLQEMLPSQIQKVCGGGPNTHLMKALPSEQSWSNSHFYPQKHKYQDSAFSADTCFGTKFTSWPLMSVFIFSTLSHFFPRDWQTADSQGKNCQRKLKQLLPNKSLIYYMLLLAFSCWIALQTVFQPTEWFLPIASLQPMLPCKVCRLQLHQFQW